MDLETRRFSFSDFFNTVPKCISASDLETKLVIKSLIQDDKIQLVNISKRLFVSNSQDRTDYQTAVVSKLLRLCCMLDSVDCATSLINGDLGPVAVVNQVDKSSGMSALHLAAEFHAARCVELLLKKRARTDAKSKDGRGLLPLELSLSSSSSCRMKVSWNPDEYTVEDLICMLGEKDLTTVKLLSEKTKELDEVAYANAVRGRIVALAALLVVAADKVNESILVLHDSDSGTKEKTTVYECVIREALALGRATTTPTTLRAVKRNCTPTSSESAEKRKLLLCEIELLQLFGAVAHGSCTDKKVGTPLILAAQAGDEAVVEILLKSSIDVNDAGAEGNSALHWALRTPSNGSSQHERQNRIISLLLKQGAQVNQKNKLGLTALHVAASSGNSQALEVFIREDPDSINFKTIMKETPLFFAVKNDQMVCAELLLSWGANSEVLNLRRERPIDLAKSQDMRFLLKAANICHKNLAVLSENKYDVKGDEVILETCEALLSIVDGRTNTERVWSCAKVEVCKYFDSPTGCARGSKCLYAHGEEELQKTKQGMHLIRSSKEEFKRKIFVGGLPLSLDSDSLAEFFEEYIGSVEDAIVIGVQTEKQIQSRGFGFVTFKNEKSVSTAVQARFVSIMGKQVEIKSALAKDLLLAEFQKQSAQLQESAHVHSQLQAKSQGEETTEKMTCRKATEEILTKKIAEEMPCRKITEEAKTEEMSWAYKLLHGQPKTCSNDSQARDMGSFEEKNIPKWLRTFKTWLPHFLKDVYRNPTEGGYALSSLKSDFKAVFGLELDHASLGYPKLSDFIKTLPNLCHIKAGTICKNGSPNHMVLLPSPPRRNGRVQQSFTNIQRLSSPSNSGNDSNHCAFNDSKSPWEIQQVPKEYAGLIVSTNERESSHDVPAQRDTSISVDPAAENVPMIDYSRFVQFLNPSSFCYNGNAGGSGGNNNGGGGQEESEVQSLRPLLRHPVLESFARRRNNRSEYFLREFDFYDDYKARLAKLICFGCNQRPMIWGNISCHHLLWCNDCRLQAVTAADGFDHKCVICDMKIEYIDFLPSNRDNQQPLSENCSNTEASPSLSNTEAVPPSPSTEVVPPSSSTEAVLPLSSTEAFPTLSCSISQSRSMQRTNRHRCGL